MPTRPRIVFLSHSGSLNGATIVLLHFLRWLKKTVEWDLEVLVFGKGPLVTEFRSIGRTRLCRNPQALVTRTPRVLQPLLMRAVEIWCFGSLWKRRRPDVVYANTAA